jgi:hypothetical protein
MCCTNFEYSKVSLEAVNKPFYGFSQYMCNSVEVVKNMWVRQMFDRSDTLSTSARQERDFDSSAYALHDTSADQLWCV